MSCYILRLDDASDYMDVEKWSRMEELLDKYQIKPLVGVIPDNQDPALVDVYEQDPLFWEKANRWKEKGWELALHGSNHKYITEEGGMNPVNKRSEFAGVPLDEQRKKIRIGIEIFREHGIEPQIFFAPSHTFDENTLEALKRESDIRIISDTVANDVYYQNGFYFIPQQSGRVRKLPFKVCTFCYHPNGMENGDFDKLEKFLKNYRLNFSSTTNLILRKRKLSVVDLILRKAYFMRKH